MRHRYHFPSHRCTPKGKRKSVDTHTGTTQVVRVIYFSVLYSTIIQSTCQSQFKYPQVVSVGMKQRNESATASIGDILLPREKNGHLHARRDTVVHVDATAVHGTVHRGVRHRAAPCTAVHHRAGRFLTDTHCYCQRGSTFTSSSLKLCCSRGNVAVSGNLDRHRRF